MTQLQDGQTELSYNVYCGFCDENVTGVLTIMKHYFHQHTWEGGGTVVKTQGGW